MTGNNVCAVLAWETAEGGEFVPGASRYNPLNTTQPMPGDSVFNSDGVRNYPNWTVGLQATTATLNLPFYSTIVDALTHGDNALGVLGAISTSPWGTKFSDGLPAVSQCVSAAATFDKKRVEAQAAVDHATQEIAAIQAQLDAATADRAKFDHQYQTMSTQISDAQQQLSRFAHSLFINGMEPAIASATEIMQSGDPVEYALVQSYPNYKGNHDARAIQSSLKLLQQLGKTRDQLGARINQANLRLNAKRTALARAQTALAAVLAAAFSQ